MDPDDPDGVVDGGDNGSGTAGTETPKGGPSVDPGIIGGAVGGALLVLAGVGCFVWGRQSRKKKDKVQSLIAIFLISVPHLHASTLHKVLGMRLL